MDELLPRLRFDPASPLPSPCWLEIGFGAGEHLAWQAMQNPQTLMIGCEVYRNGVAVLLSQIEREKIANIRLWPEDARDLMDRLPDRSIDRAFLLFPDPWPKKRHHKRRLVSPQFADLVASRLRSGAHIHLATDWEPYAMQMLAVLDACGALANCVPGGGFLESGPARTATRFERRGERLGHRVRELLYQRR